MADIEVKLNSAGVKALLKSGEMEAAVRQEAENIAQRAGEGYGTDVKMMKSRVIASAYTETFDAMRDEFENHTLEKAIRGAGT